MWTYRIFGGAVRGAAFLKLPYTHLSHLNFQNHLETKLTYWRKGLNAYSLILGGVKTSFTHLRQSQNSSYDQRDASSHSSSSHTSCLNKDIMTVDIIYLILKTMVATNGHSCPWVFRETGSGPFAVFMVQGQDTVPELSPPVPEPQSLTPSTKTNKYSQMLKSLM